MKPRRVAQVSSNGASPHVTGSWRTTDKQWSKSNCIRVQRKSFVFDTEGIKGRIKTPMILDTDPYDIVLIQDFRGYNTATYNKSGSF